MNQSTIIIAIFLGILIFCVPQKSFLLPFVVAACFIPADQRIIIMGLDFTILRILVVVGTLRIFVRGEYKVMKWNRFDKLFLLWAVCGAVIYVLQWQDMRSIIYKCGVLFDMLGMYWLFRQNIRSWTDIYFVFKIFALCALLTVPFVMLEWTTGHNPFLALGRVSREGMVTMVRDGRLRCQGPFPHAIMFGLYWATLVPVFMGLARTGRQKSLYFSAVAASIFIVFTTASSTPILTLVITVGLFALFSYRCYGRMVAWGLCFLTVALHIVMNAPVWHLISRIRFIGGSTGWHRYYLINKAINNFSQWALLGCRSTAHWGMGLIDVTNQYILEGVRGGLITLVLFVALLIMAVKTVGKYSLRPMPKRQQWVAWSICVSVLGHCVSFIGVSYFGQITMLLYMTFALVGWIYEISNEPITNNIVPAQIA